MSEKWSCVSRKKRVFPQGNAVYMLRTLKFPVSEVSHSHPNISGIAAFGVFPIHQDYRFSMTIFLILN